MTPDSTSAPRRTFLAEVKNAVTPRAALLVIGVLALQLLFITSYVGALHHPKPKDVPFAVVAPGSRRRQAGGPAEAAARRSPGPPRAPRRGGGARQIMDRDIDGALVVDPGGTTDSLLVACGGGSVLARRADRAHHRAGEGPGRTVRTVDVAPADAAGRHGLTLLLPGRRLVRRRLSVRGGPRDQRRGAARQPPARGDPAGRDGRWSRRRRTGRRGHRRTGPGRAARQRLGLWGLGALIVFAVGATTLAFQASSGSSASDWRSCWSWSWATRARAAPSRTRCCRRSGRRSAPPCRRARAPGRPARSPTSGATTRRPTAGALRVGGRRHRGHTRRGLAARTNGTRPAGAP